MQGFLAVSQTLNVSLLFWLLFYILETDWVFMCLGENEIEAGDKDTDTQIELVIASIQRFLNLRAEYTQAAKDLH